jgi:fatty acid desaturase
MGKGGSATLRRSALSRTVPRDGKEITKASLKECIPAHCFKRSYTRSLGHLAWDVSVFFLTLWSIHWATARLPTLAAVPAWIVYWWYQGVNTTALWVLAHECGHGGFSESQVLNDCVGFILHSSLLTPYFSWAITHAKHHHYTNHMTMGETWVPDRATDENKVARVAAKTPLATSIRIGVVAVLGWYFYLLVNATGAAANFGQSHFNPRSRALFKPKDAMWVRLSTIGFLCGISAIGVATRTWGLAEVVRSYLIPQMITCVAANDKRLPNSLPSLPYS